MKRKNPLMTSEQFAALVRFLAGPEGCDFTEAPLAPEGLTWSCDETLNLTKQWMREHQIQFKANLQRIRALGGHCDCEVVFNVTEQWERDED